MGGSTSESLNDESQERNRLGAVWKEEKTCVGVLPHGSRAQRSPYTKATLRASLGPIGGMLSYVVCLDG